MADNSRAQKFLTKVDSADVNSTEPLKFCYPCLEGGMMIVDATQIVKNGGGGGKHKGFCDKCAPEEGTVPAPSKNMREKFIQGKI